MPGSPARRTSTAGTRAWWVEEMQRLRPSLSAMLKRKCTFDPPVAKEIVDDLQAGLVARFHAAQEQYPASWFMSEDPGEEEAAAFRRFARHVAMMRLRDELRKHYVRQRSAPEEQTVGDRRDDEIIDARRFLLALIPRLDTLAFEDRELLERAIDGQLDGRERVRLHRLRRNLVARVKKDLGL
jgi:hypothetical protein